MKITAVAVQNYRSIEKQTRFCLGNLTTLIGPNNEGKSNLLRAIGLGMRVIRLWSRADDSMVSDASMSGARLRTQLRTRRGDGLPPDSMSDTDGYDWSEDYPRDKQGRSGVQPTLIQLTFALDDNESLEFTSETGIKNNGDLPIVIKIYRDRLDFGIAKPGRGNATHKQKSREIAQFIDEHLTFVAVPAIRTSRQALELINQLIRIKSETMVQSDDYKDLMERLEKLYNSVNQEVERGITSTVQRYVNDIKSVTIKTRNIRTLNSIDDLVINDGVETSVASKGDGIKSLITMALIHELYQIRSQTKSFVLAVDEPEAHLHPDSIHELQNLFDSLADEQQVIVATHNPIFANRDSIRSNIIVKDNEAKSAKSLKDIRNSLGVWVSDNLESAEVVVLVEGVTEENSLGIALSRVSPQIKNDIRERRVYFKATHGVSGLKTAISSQKNTVCKILCILDNDNGGKAGLNVIKNNNLLPHEDVFIFGGSSMPSEYEDMFDPEIYVNEISRLFRREFSPDEFPFNGVTWVNKLKKSAITHGLGELNSSEINKAKESVQNSVINYEQSPWRSEIEWHAIKLADWIHETLVKK